MKWMMAKIAYTTTESPRSRFTPFLLGFSFAGDGVVRDREDSN
jgi:hypothetical protein